MFSLPFVAIVVVDNIALDGLLFVKQLTTGNSPKCYWRAFQDKELICEVFLSRARCIEGG